MFAISWLLAPGLAGCGAPEKAPTIGELYIGPTAYRVRKDLSTRNPARFERTGDLFAPVLKLKQRLEPALERLEKRLRLR